jgi:parallel beta-helix repeat protein
MWLMPDRQSHAAGNTYYVAMNGNDANSGSQSQPWKTLQKAASSARAGDTVVVRAGRYAGFQKNLQGASGAPITFKASPGERVTLDANLSPSSAGGCAVICLRGTVSYLVFDGFEITDTHPDRDRLRQLDLNNPQDYATYEAWINVRKNSERESGSRGIRLDSYTPAHHIIYRNLHIHDLFSNAFAGRHDFTEFINNHIHHLGRPKSGYGWYMTGDHNVFRGNRIHHNTYGAHLYTDIRGVPLSNTVLENNIVYENGQTIVFSGNVRTTGVGILISPGTNNIIRNNVFYNNKIVAGLSIQSSNTLVLNNTFYGNRAALTFYGNNDGKNSTIRNNIFHNNGTNIGSSGTTVTASHNLEADPLFVDAAAGEFRLRPGSPAINAGVSLPQVPCDFDGNKRPAASGYDIGAFEYGSSPMNPC